MKSIYSGYSPRLPSLIFVFAALTLAVIRLVSAEEFQARLRNGNLVSGRLRGKSARDLTFLVEGKPRSLNGIERIQCPPSSPVLANDRPARVFSLRGGGQITGELLGFTEKQVTLNFQGNPITLPKEAILTIGQPLGEQQVFYEDFNSPKLSSAWKKAGEANLARIGKRAAIQLLPSGSLAYSLEKPLSAARFSAAFFDPGRDSSVKLELQFGERQSATHLTIVLASSEGTYTVEHSPMFRLTKQPLRRNPGWRGLTVLFDETRFQVLIDSHLLAFGRAPQVPLATVRFSSQTSRNAGSKPLPGFWLDDVQLAKLIPQMQAPPPISFHRQAQAILADGDKIFGEVSVINSQQIQLQGAFGETALPWNQLQQVIFAEYNDPLPTEKSSPQGWQAEVTFQRFADHPYQPGDNLSVTLLAADADSLSFHHPWLGNLIMSWDQVDVIELKFFGRSYILCSDAEHLGNQLKPGFRREKPFGTIWQGKFALEQIPSGSSSLHLQVAELEPAGRETPPGSRYLSELRGGFLGTEIFLNGQSLGRLNDRIHRRSLVGSPQSLRLPIPANLLKAGRNTWRIEQTSLTKNSTEYDDCELGPLVLEIEEADSD